MGTIYRLPYVHPDIPLLIINGVGILFAGIYIFLALKSSTGRKRVTIAVVFPITLVFIGAFSAGIFVGVQTPDRRSVIVGPACDVSGILTYVSTIPALLRAWRTKNIENVSLFLTGAGLANSITWLIYAILKFETFMMIQNGIGFIVCCIQLTLYQKIIAAATDLPR
ncbi:Bidirectional sugar transporter SWEET6a [Carex littledalei]|uniref:Bidirectional sugar transporter SWEET6a n=1 Tax=Carex littledalei TaxID=544730 RepID=A0A833RGH5_9POAL|nr:Bidirectional sugar transporter SWEET6a [Carex littledalei]